MIDLTKLDFSFSANTSAHFNSNYKLLKPYFLYFFAIRSNSRFLLLLGIFITDSYSIPTSPIIFNTSDSSLPISPRGRKNLPASAAVLYRNLFHLTDLLL